MNFILGYLRLLRLGRRFSKTKKKKEKGKHNMDGG